MGPSKTRAEKAREEASQQATVEDIQGGVASMELQQQRRIEAKWPPKPHTLW